MVLARRCRPRAARGSALGVAAVLAAGCGVSPAGGGSRAAGVSAGPASVAPLPAGSGAAGSTQAGFDPAAVSFISASNGWVLGGHVEQAHVKPRVAHNSHLPCTSSHEKAVSSLPTRELTRAPPGQLTDQANAEHPSSRSRAQETASPVVTAVRNHDSRRGHARTRERRRSGAAGPRPGRRRAAPHGIPGSPAARCRPRRW
jgi:hypothetical protein